MGKKDNQYWIKNFFRVLVKSSKPHTSQGPVVEERPVVKTTRDYYNTYMK